MSDRPTAVDTEVQDFKALLYDLKQEDVRASSIKKPRPKEPEDGSQKQDDNVTAFAAKKVVVKNDSHMSKKDDSKKEIAANTSQKKVAVDRKKSTGASVRSQTKEIERIKKEEEAERKRLRKLEIERRILLATFGIAVVTSFVFLIALTSEFWVTVEFPVSVLVLRNETDRGVTFYKTGHYHGLWRICRKEFYNETAEPAELRK